MPCTKFCSNHFVRIDVRVKRNFHRILNSDGKTVSEMVNLMYGKVWDELLIHYPNSSDATVEVWEWINNFAASFVMCDYLSILAKGLHIPWDVLYITGSCYYDIRNPPLTKPDGFPTTQTRSQFIWQFQQKKHMLRSILQWLDIFRNAMYLLTVWFMFSTGPMKPQCWASIH